MNNIHWSKHSPLLKVPNEYQQKYPKHFKTDALGQFEEEYRKGLLIADLEGY